MTISKDGMLPGACKMYLITAILLTFFELYPIMNCSAEKRNRASV
jgi:hypothetical protein